MSSYCKYYKEKEQVSYDNGVTWIDVSGATRKGNLIQMDSPDCGYVPPTPTGYSNQYLTFVPMENGYFSFSGTSSQTIDNSSIQYSLDSGSTWNTLDRGNWTEIISAGQKIMWKSSTLQPISDYNISTYNGIGKFKSTGDYIVEGNVMSLLYGDNFRNKTSLSEKDYAFSRLFYNNNGIRNIDNLILPATTLSNFCYVAMFMWCMGIRSAENLSLPATALAPHCYEAMFMGCTSLTALPTLPATTMEFSCYNDMFAGCSGLTSIPSNYLPATTMAESCYSQMFQECTSLTTVPSNLLPATTLAYYCYGQMFYECTSLTTAPQLPATTLANWCCGYMFYGCTSLTTVPDFPVATMAESCYQSMFDSCTSLRTAPVLPTTTLSADFCYDSMFNNCTSLNYVKCLASNRTGNWTTSNWLKNVSSTGTFVKKSGATWSTGDSGIPSGWTVTNA